MTSEFDGKEAVRKMSEDPSVGDWQDVLAKFSIPVSADEADVSRLEESIERLEGPVTVKREDLFVTKDSGKPDVVNMPSHYTKLPVECIDVTEHFNFTLGNAIKYIWRADHKGKPVEDLKKAQWYIQREIDRRERDGR